MPCEENEKQSTRTESTDAAVAVTLLRGMRHLEVEVLLVDLGADRQPHFHLITSPIRCVTPSPQVAAHHKVVLLSLGSILLVVVVQCKTVQRTSLFVVRVTLAVVFDLELQGLDGGQREQEYKEDAQERSGQHLACKVTKLREAMIGL